MSAVVIKKTDYATKVMLCQQYDKWRAQEENADEPVDVFVQHMHYLLTRKEYPVGQNPTPTIQSLRLKFHGMWYAGVRRGHNKKSLKLHQYRDRSAIKEIVTQCECTHIGQVRSSDACNTGLVSIPTLTPPPPVVHMQVTLSKTNYDGGLNQIIGTDHLECHNVRARRKSEANWSARQARK